MEYHLYFHNRNGVNIISYLFPGQLVINCFDGGVDFSDNPNILEKVTDFLAERRGQMAKDGFLKTGFIDKDYMPDLHLAALIGGESLEGMLRDLRAKVEEGEDLVSV